MNKKKLLAGLLCVCIALAAMTGCVVEEDTWEPPTIPEETDPTQTAPTQEATQPDPVPPETVEPPSQLPPTVEIPTVQDPQTGKPAGVRFPCNVPGYGLTIEKLAPYDGMYVEDGSNTQLMGVAMLLIKNNGNFPVEYTRICVEYEQESLIFDISALPIGERIVVQEKEGKMVPQGNPKSATALVVQRGQMQMSQDQLRVTDNGDNTLTVENLTDQTIPTVRVFYKYYMEDEDVFVGGIAFTARITRLAAGQSVTIQPSHYTSQSSRVVMVLTYDTEV